MELISVIMSTYKEPVEWVQNAVLSIINQTYKNIEIIIVIDDPENEEVVAYIDRIKGKYSNIKTIINDENEGIVKSLNKALTVCNGEYIARMDADDIALPNRFEKQLEFMKKRGLDMVGTAYCVFPSDGQGLVVQRNPQHSFICHLVLRYRNCVVHPSWLVKKEVYQRVGGYRDIIACEDYDFLVRAILVGFKIGNIPEMLLLYRNNVQSISHKEKWRQRAMMELVAKEFRKGKELSLEKYKKYYNGSQIEKDIFLLKKIIDFEKQTYKGRQKKRIKTAKNILLSGEFRRKYMIDHAIGLLLFIDKY